MVLPSCAVLITHPARRPLPARLPAAPHAPQIHAAKGLEWDAVFVPLFTNDVLPSLWRTRNQGVSAPRPCLPGCALGQACKELMLLLLVVRMHVLCVQMLRRDTGMCTRLPSPPVPQDGMPQSQQQPRVGQLELPQLDGAEEDLAEQRRLAHVAATRARRHLFATWSRTARRFGRVFPVQRSDFLERMLRKLRAQCSSAEFAATVTEEEVR